MEVEGVENEDMDSTSINITSINNNSADKEEEEESQQTSKSKSRKINPMSTTTTSLFIKCPKSSDRLSIDKEYLALLANDLGGQRNTTGRKVAHHAQQTLSFLKNQDTFWKQMRNKGKQPLY